MKLWDKGINTNKLIEVFTVGNDRNIDAVLAKYDVIGSLAHAKMLHEINILTEKEFFAIEYELLQILELIESCQFIISKDAEDIHSQIEIILTEKLGETGKKIHTGRSRNDQVLLAIKLFLRNEISEIVKLSTTIFSQFIELSELYKDFLMPGYTHLQVAMPSSFGLWFGSYAEALIDDLIMLQASYKIVNQNPLGSAAGYGTSIPLNRKLTTQLLGFDDLTYNSIASQLGRGKTELVVSFALASMATTFSKFASDVCLYNCQNFDFICLPDEFTTGSSIMPHKKNPDVFELIRSKCNKIKNIPNDIMMITSNLTSGYHRDFQILKETLFSGIFSLKECLEILCISIPNIKVKNIELSQEKYKYIFSVEEVNKKVMDGISFREAYKEVVGLIANGKYNPKIEINHKHEGSINNLCNDKINNKWNILLQSFNFKICETAIDKLVNRKL